MGRNNEDFQGGTQKWYHGSKADLPDGTVLTPGADRGVNNYPPAGDNTAVWVAPQGHYALHWGYGTARKGQQVHVYEVEPHEPPVSSDDGKGHKTTAATIIRKVDSVRKK